MTPRHGEPCVNAVIPSGDMTFGSINITQAVALAIALLVLPATRVSAQTPAIYEATAHGRVLACFGEAYALVELLDVATLNLALLSAELHRTALAARPAVAAGLVLAGTPTSQRQALDVAERLVECSEGAARRAAPDPAAAYTAQAVREEIDVAIMMAEGFTADYQMLAARMMQFFAESTDPAAKTAPTRDFTRFGDEVRAALVRGRTAIDQVVSRSASRP